MGRRDKWNEMYVVQRGALVDYAATLTGSRDEAEDIVQEAYLNFANAESRNAEDGPPLKAYLYRIVRNLSFNKLKQKKRDTGRNPTNLPFWALPMRIENPEDNALLSDKVSRLEAVMASMPERTRRILQMHRFEGYTLEEIAGELGISVTTVHRLLGDAMEMVKNALRRHVV